MNTVLEIAIPVFAIGLLGYLATRLGWFSAQAGEGLALFVFNFAIPALLLRSFANTDSLDNFQLNFIAAYYLPVALIYLLGVLVAKTVFGRPFEGQVVTGFSSAYGNAVMLGLPIVLLTLGDASSLPYFILLSLHALSLFAVTTVLLEYSRHRNSSLLKMTGSIVIGLAKNPILLGIGAGICLNQLGLPLTGAIDTTLAYLQNAVAACSLFTLGASLTRYRIAGQIKQAMAVVLTKNFLLPGLVFFSCSVVFGLNSHWTFIAVLMAAQPTGINAYIFAERYGTAQALASSTVFLSTVVSMASISAILYLYDSGWFG